MKKIFATALSIGAFAIASDAALAQNSNAVFAGVNAGRNINYGYLGAATALNGNIEKDGVLLRVAGAYGQYTYQTPAVTGGGVRGQITSSDLMAGYQHNFGFGRATIYAGGTYENYDLNKGDNGNRVAGGKAGGKGQFELSLNLTKSLVFQNVSNYSSPYHSYWSQSYLGWDFGKFTFGPEVAFLGNTTFNQQRFGAQFANLDVGIGKVYVGGGYLKSSGMLGNDGGYVSAGITSKF